MADSEDTKTTTPLSLNKEFLRQLSETEDLSSGPGKSNPQCSRVQDPTSATDNNGACCWIC